jgi:hypothetical protein
MFAAVEGAEVRRIIVDEFDVRGEPGTRIRAFDQIVAEQGIAREAPVKNGMEGSDFIDALCQ